MPPAPPQNSLPARGIVRRFRAAAARRTAALLLTSVLLTTVLLAAGGCARNNFPQYPAAYREFAYVPNAADGTVAVLDLVNLRRDRVLAVGRNPVAAIANPARHEVYILNAGSNSVSVIDAQTNGVARTLGVSGAPTAAAVSADGRRAYIATASGRVDVLDLMTGRQIASVPSGATPSALRLAKDNTTLVVASRGSSTLSIFSVHADDATAPLTLRATLPSCNAPADLALVDDANSPKALAVCPDRTVAVYWLAVTPTSYRGRQDASLTRDALLTRLHIGAGATALVLKADGGEAFTLNTADDSLSELSTWTNEVESTVVVGSRPVAAVASRDNATLWIANAGADAVSLFSIDDGRVAGSVHTGSNPGALAFSADEHLLLAADRNSGDVAVIQTNDKAGPHLLTMLPSGNAPGSMAVLSYTSR